MSARWHQAQGPAWLALVPRLSAKIDEVVKNRGFLLVRGPSGCGKSKIIEYLLKSKGLTWQTVIDDGDLCPSYSESLFRDARCRLTMVMGPSVVIFKYPSELGPEKFKALLRGYRHRALIMTDGLDYESCYNIFTEAEKGFIIKFPQRAFGPPTLIMPDGSRVQTRVTQADADMAGDDGCPKFIAPPQAETERIVEDSFSYMDRLMSCDKRVVTRFFKASEGVTRYLEQQTSVTLSETLSYADTLRYEGLMNFETMVTHILPRPFISGRPNAWNKTMAFVVRINKGHENGINRITVGSTVLSDVNRLSVSLVEPEVKEPDAPKKGRAEKAAKNFQMSLVYMAPKRLAPEPAVDIGDLNAALSRAAKRPRK